MASTASASPSKPTGMTGRYPPPQGVTPNFVNPVSRKDEVLVGAPILLAFTLVVVAARVSIRVFIIHSMGWDDYLCILATLLVIAGWVSALELTKWGYGTHLWDLLKVPGYHQASITWNISIYLLYLTAMGTIKLSALAFYLRIFSIGPILRATIYALIAIVGASLVGGDLSLVFACRPIKAFYVYGAVEDPKCIKLQHHVTTTSVINIITDFIIVALPGPMVWRLQLPLRQKIAVVGIFSTGFLVCGVSIARLVAIFASRRIHPSPDYTWDDYDGTVWSVIEMIVALLGSCLPTLKPLLRKLAPWARKVSSRGSFDEDVKRSTPSNLLGSPAPTGPYQLAREPHGPLTPAAHSSWVETGKHRPLPSLTKDDVSTVRIEPWSELTESKSGYELYTLESPRSR